MNNGGMNNGGMNNGGKYVKMNTLKYIVIPK